MLKIKKLSKSFGKKKVLKNINLEVKKGEVLGIIGPSGCGKSTLLRCLNRLEEPTSGTIILENETIDKNYDLNKLRRNIGMVFQQFNLFSNMNVLDNIIMAPTILNILTKDEAIKRARKLLKEIDLKDKEENFPDELSGGQKQRVAIIRALLMEPKILMFDEPTSALDPEMVGEVVELMKNLREQGMTMLIVSHDINLIKKISTRVIFLDEGKIIEEGTPEDILIRPKSEQLKKFLIA